MRRFSILTNARCSGSEPACNRSMRTANCGDTFNSFARTCLRGARHGTATAMGNCPSSCNSGVSCFKHLGCSFGRACVFSTVVHTSNSSGFTGNGR